MAQFPEYYFEDEEREGFLIEGMMKRAWAAQIEVLEIIDCVCKENDLRYYADWGTLLGAVRHKGFIPWDDDIDITMEREDYMKFVELARQGLPNGCSLLSIYTEETYHELFARVVNTRAISFEQEHLTYYHGCPFVLGVDIFPIDKLPLDVGEEQVQCEMLQLLRFVVQLCDRGVEDINNLLDQIEVVCRIKIDRDKNIKNQLLRVMDQICQMYNDGDENEITQFSSYLDHRNYRMRGQWYQDVVMLPFEMIQIPAPHEYDAVLRAMYGDYHTPVRGAGDHDYPFYKDQQRLIDEYIDQMQGE